MKRIRKLLGIRKKAVLMGGGKLAGLVYSMFKDEIAFAGYIDDINDMAYVERTYGLKKIGTSGNASQALKHTNNVVIAITDTSAREKYRKIFKERGFKLLTLVSPNAIVASNAKIGDGCIIRHNAIISAKAVVGENTVISDKAYIGHDCEIGDNVFIGPDANINGSVLIGNNSFIGTGANVIPQLKVGENCVVGAGSCVIKNISDNSRVAGVPARPIKPAEEEIKK